MFIEKTRDNCYNFLLEIFSYYVFESIDIYALIQIHFELNSNSFLICINVSK